MTPSGGLGEFSFKLRVYIEDTDAGGLSITSITSSSWSVHVPNSCAAQGYGKDYIFNHDLMFVVRDVAVKYLLPARLDDELEATASILRLRGAVMVFSQSVRRGDEILAQGEVTIACVDRSRRKAASPAAGYGRQTYGDATRTTVI